MLSKFFLKANINKNDINLGDFFSGIPFFIFLDTTQCFKRSNWDTLF